MKKDQKELERKIAILEAAIELVAEQGFHNTTTAQIAKKAQVGVGTMYRHFQSKDEIMKAVFEFILDQQDHEILKGYDQNAPFREQFMHVCHTLVQFTIHNPSKAKFVDQFRHSPYDLVLWSEEKARVSSSGFGSRKPPFVPLFEGAIAQQVVKDLPLFILGTLTFRAIFELMHDINVGMVPYDADLVQRFIEACWDAIKR